MSIPYWRNVDYTDDGCSLYECLNCYKQWEARTNPNFSDWKFCPYCGCTWKGQKEWDQNVKWDRKKGRNPAPDSRLAMSLFIVQHRSVSFNDDDDENSEWQNIRSSSENLRDSISTIEFYSSREADYDLFYCSQEYRIVFEPYHNGYPQKPIAPRSEQKLKWIDSHRIKNMFSVWEKHKNNERIIQEKEKEAKKCLN